jgi:SagB-type dehydrogenase family enzyme
VNDSLGETGAITRAYHRRTKHHLRRYARSPDSLDWAMQPDPFRTFESAPQIDLPLLADRFTTPFIDLYRLGGVPPQPLSLETLAVLFELSLGLSAWKEYRGNRWALRCNPSSGNLHPTEAYAVAPELPGLGGGVYHYVSRDHCLEQRCTLNGVTRLPPGAFLVGFSSVHWREAWKYGERAFRYCQHDLGHALATVSYAAATLGWSAVLLDHLGDDTVAALLGLDDEGSFKDVAPPDREHPDAILLIQTNPATGATILTGFPVKAPREVRWVGRANPLSPRHVDWPVIHEVAAATRKPATEPARPTGNVPFLTSPVFSTTSQATAVQIIRQRRSCLALDATTMISAEVLFRMLDRLLPRPGVPPWNVLPWQPLVHVVLFVHRVQGLAPGLYALERCLEIHDRLRAALDPAFAWERVANTPESVRLFLLMAGECRDTARLVSCHQEIASDGAFSLAMLADFTTVEQGAWWYRRLFWEAGMLGQVLYLEAEAAGLRGTGIGCYFDDLCHERLGLRDESFQDVYHFTVGSSVEDSRLLTLPAYAHLER